MSAITRADICAVPMCTLWTLITMITLADLYRAECTVCVYIRLKNDKAITYDESCNAQ